MSTILDLSGYLGKEIHCSCGQVHSTRVKLIDIDREAAKRLPGHIKELGYNKVYLVADRNTWEAAGKKAAEELAKAQIPCKTLVLADDLVPDENTVGKIQIAFPKDADVLLAVGSGTINDLAKFVSYQMDRDYIIFASAPSMDGFVSIGSALMLDCVKTTLDAHGPAAVIGDTEILAKAPMNMITAGFGDILGKYTCLLDWKISSIINGEDYCEEVDGMVCQAIEIVKEQSGKLVKRDIHAVKAVMEALVLSGIAMSFVGNSRPASGCEHHLSHYWEMEFIKAGKKPILHGTKVGLGLITTLKMYHMLADENIDFERLLKETKENDVALKRLLMMKENWGLIQKTIKESLPDLEETERLMVALDAPINPAEIEIPLELMEEGIINARKVRKRYTLLQMLNELGLSEKYASIMTDYFANNQDVYNESLRIKNQKKIDQIKMFVLDMDGTIYLENNLFPFTKTFLEKVEKSGRDYCYFTNNSSKNQGDYLTKLDVLGIPTTPDKMFLSSLVIIEWLKEHHPNDSFYVVGTQSLLDSFEENGLKLDNQHPDVVILAFDTTLTYAKLDKACYFLRHGAAYYGVNMDYNCPMAGGEYIPDCGSMAKLIERSTGRFPEFFGKPSRHTLEYVIRHTGYKEEEIAVIGDRIYTDIALANDSKATSIMVLTGETQLKDLKDYDYRPDIIMDSLESLIEML